MAGLRRTGRFLVMVLIPWLTAGCAGTTSRVAKWTPQSAESQDQIWARAQQFEQNGRFTEAQQLYSELCRSDVKSAKYAHRLGIVSTMAGDHERAFAAYSKARELDPENADLLTDMGYAAYLQQDYVEAERLLRAALDLAADNPRATSNLALAVGFQGRYDECISLFRQVHGQDEAEVLCNLAYVKSQRGETKDAAALYQQVLAIDPHVKKATVALAAMKAAEAKPAQVAQKKLYRKYMNENAPTVAKSQPVDRPVVKAEIAETVGKTTITLTAMSDYKDEVQSLDDDDRALTGWSEQEDDLSDSAAPKRVIPEGLPAVMDQEAAWSAAPMPGELQTATSDDIPFAIAEDPAAEEPVAVPAPAPAEIPEPVEAAFEQPKELSNDWSVTRSHELQMFGPEWLASRLEQIAERRGQSGFMGFCPVALREEQKLIDTLPQYTAEFQSQRYEFSSEEAQKKFEAQPERYLPAAGGLDVVAVSQGTAVAQGSLEHALWFRHKLYLFLTRENLEIFRIQARQFAVQQ